jgi:hypothetical protein
MGVVSIYGLVSLAPSDHKLLEALAWFLGRKLKGNYYITVRIPEADDLLAEIHGGWKEVKLRLMFRVSEKPRDK